MSSPMNASSSHVLRKSAAQWPNQIRLYHSTVQQSPCFAFKWYVQFLCYCFSAVSLIIDTHCLKKKEKENLTTRIFSKCWKKSKWSQQLDLKYIYIYIYCSIFHCLPVLHMYLQASRTVMDSNRSTAEFDIPNLSAEQEGLWECRVSTDGGQDSREFTLTVKGEWFTTF